MTTGTAGQQIAFAGTQPNIGAYVQEGSTGTGNQPCGDTTFAGCNPAIGYATNALGCDIGFTCPVNSGAAQATKSATWCSSAVVLIPTDKVDVTAGVATKNNATGLYMVYASVPAAGYFWAVLI